MKTTVLMSGVALLLTLSSAQAGPAEDLKAFQGYFKKQFKDVPFNDYGNGIYALDKSLREQWKSIEEFPPYEPDVDKGKELWAKPFANGKGYKDCFSGDVKSIRAKYPQYDKAKDTIVTLEDAINDCRKANNEEPIKDLNKGEMVQLSAYIAMEGRGTKISIPTPKGKAVDWYDKGKNFFYAKRGQLNMSCADCHVYNAGKMIRADLLSPALGQITHWPVYRSVDGETRSLHNRYVGCNRQVRANSFKVGGDEYKALEYFQTYMANGLTWNGPASRR